MSLENLIKRTREWCRRDAGLASWPGLGDVWVIVATDTHDQLSLGKERYQQVKGNLGNRWPGDVFELKMDRPGGHWYHHLLVRVESEALHSLLSHGMA